jgi:hypothetical protein
MMCECCKKYENGNWLSEPCCDSSGVCESDATDPNTTIGNCIHCGGEMFKEGGIWWHNSQQDIPIGERGTTHSGV